MKTLRDLYYGVGNSKVNVCNKCNSKRTNIDRFDLDTKIKWYVNCLDCKANYVMVRRK